MEYLTIQEPRSTHFRGMEHHQSAYYGSQPRDNFHQPRSSTDRSDSPSHGPSEPRISGSDSKSSRWPSSGYYQQSTSPQQSVTSVPSATQPPRSIASLLQSEQSEPAPKMKRMSSDEWNGAPQSAPVRSIAAPVHESQPKDDRPTLPSFNAVCFLSKLCRSSSARRF